MKPDLLKENLLLFEACYGISTAMNDSFFKLTIFLVTRA